MNDGTWTRDSWSLPKYRLIATKKNTVTGTTSSSSRLFLMFTIILKLRCHEELSRPVATAQQQEHGDTSPGASLTMQRKGDITAAKNCGLTASGDQWSALSNVEAKQG